MKKALSIFLAAVTLTGCLNIKFNKEGLLNITGDAIELGSSKKIKAEGPAVVKAYPVEAFTAIKVNGGFDVDITVGDETKVEVEAAENIQDVLKIETADGVLVISTKDKVAIDRSDISIQTPALRAITINGAGDIDINSDLECEDFVLEINGAGDVSTEKIACKGLSVKVNGAGDVDFKEIDCANLDVKINGAGDFSVAGKAVDVNAEISGVGEIDASALEVSGTFNKKVSGIGKVKKN